MARGAPPALVAWPLYYVGLNEEWRLEGTGDGWQLIAFLFTLVGVATTAFAVALARVFWRA